MVFEIKLKTLQCFINSGENLLLFKLFFNTLFPLLFSMHYITFNETWLDVYHDFRIDKCHEIILNTNLPLAFSSVQSLRRVRILWPHGQQHTRPPCPSPRPWVYSNSCPLSRWCHPAISSSVIPFSSHLQSFLASGYIQSNIFL